MTEKGPVEFMSAQVITEWKKLAGLTESDADIIQECGAIRLRIYEAGEYVDKETKEKVEFPEGIELRAGGARLGCHASDLALLIHYAKANPDVKRVLSERFKAEQDILKTLSL